VSNKGVKIMKALKKRWIIIGSVIVLIACVSIIFVFQNREKPGDLPGWIPRMMVTGSPGETITFRNGEVTLAGVLDLPAGNGPFPAIVTVHGSPPLTRNDRYNLYISDFFLQHGFAVLRYDKRGAGESTGTYPDIGDYYDTGNASLFEEDSTAKFNELANDALAGDIGETVKMSEQEASEQAKNYDGIQGYDPLPTLQKVNVPGL
jgi:hypothetical protein